MVDRSKNRSDSYQWVLAEIPTDFSTLPEEMLTAPTQDGGELFELRTALMALMWRKAEEVFTPRQWAVFSLYFREGLTQVEIAKKLGVNQSSVTKSINGNCDYRKGGIFYGGGLKKLRRVMMEDPQVLALLEAIAEVEKA